MPFRLKKYDAKEAAHGSELLSSILKLIIVVTRIINLACVLNCKYCLKQRQKKKKKTRKE
jgi:sulfatase maturation enzyme AslB (radical SAM superfamily)